MLVDIADPATWPAGIAERLDDTKEPEAFERIDIPELDGHTLRLWHCARLTPSEVTDINTNGLQPWSEELINRKLTLAVLDGEITTGQADAIRQWRTQRSARDRYLDSGRAGWTCLFTALHSVTHGKLNGVLNNWGGELDITNDPITALGKPHIIEAKLAIAEIGHGHAGIGHALWHRHHKKRHSVEVRPRRGNGIPAANIIRIHNEDSDLYQQVKPRRH